MVVAFKKMNRCVCFLFVLVNSCKSELTIDQNNTGISQWQPKPGTPEHRQRMATPCETPNLEAAYCIEIQKCPVLYLNWNNSKSAEFIRLSRCGPPNEDATQPKVCCGTYSDFKEMEKPNSPLPKKCGNQNVTNNIKNRILGGVEANLGEFPWMARIVHRNVYEQKNFGCAGFLIHSKYVLTAAHCLQKEFISKIGQVYEVLLGEHDTTKAIDCDSKNYCADPPQHIRVGEIIVHPRYDSSTGQYHHDIGLLHLKKAAKLGSWVYPICLTDTNMEASEYWISGWGKTETLESSPVKMKLSLPSVPWERCRALYRGIDLKVIKSQLCAGGLRNKDSCTGDSGGPLMAKSGSHWFAAGLVSYGLGCGREEWPGVYTNIPSYVDWIKKQIVKTSTSKKKNGAKQK